MSYLNSMKATEDILTLLESWDAQEKTGLEASSPIGDNKGDIDPFGTVSLDDINDTVEPQDSAFEPENLIGDEPAVLTDAEKSIVRENLSNMLSELKGDEISEPALEMIIEEVAKNSSFLTEAEENQYETPVEKSQGLDKKELAVADYIKELLGQAAENDGVLPEEPVEGAEKTEETTETPAEEKTEEGAEGAVKPEGEEAEEKTEAVATDKPEMVEAEEVVPEEKKAPVEEGVCTECGDTEIVDVPEEDVIKVVDDSEVEPINMDVTGEVETEEDSKYATKADVDEIKEMLKSFIGNTAAVFESAGLIQGTDAIKSVEGGNPSLGTPHHSSAQKTAKPAIAKPGFKIATLRNLTDKPAKAESNAPFGKENEAAQAKAAPAFKKGEKDQGKSNTAPDGGIPSTVAPKKAKETPKPTDPVKAAVVRESVTSNPAKSWLAEAAKLIREGK